MNRTTRAKNPGRVVFVGSGPGDAGLLTVRALECLRRADTVVLDGLTQEGLVLRHAPVGVEILDAGPGERGTPLSTASRARLLVKAAKAVAEQGLVVRLIEGDAGVFSGLAEEALALHKAGVPFEIVPGVSHLAAVPAYAGIPVTAASTQALHVVVAGQPRVDWSGSVSEHVTVVVVGCGGLAGTLREILAAGRDEQTPVALTSSGTTTRQRTHTATLAEAVGLLDGGHVESVSLAVVGSTVGLREELSWFETKPLFGWHVLVPRTKDQAEGMVDRLESYGATSDVVPTISVEPPRTPQQMERAIKGLVTGRYEWIGFTSVNAVRAVREKFQEFGLDARAFAGLRIAAVGGTTAAALRAWGLEPDLVPAGEQSANGLLEEWPPYDDVLDPINRVFLPRADIATDTLVAGLQAMGWEVDDVTAYRTVRAAPPAAEIREAIKSGRYDGVVFTSSSTVRNLVGIAGKPHPSTVIACIGPQTAKTAEEHGLRVDVLAPEASADSLVDALADYGRGLALAAEQSGEGGPVRPSERKAAARRKAK